jgi:hypothetical protein
MGDDEKPKVDDANGASASAKPLKRVRVSLWGSTPIPANLSSYKGIIDDVSLLRTFWFDINQPGMVVILDKNARTIPKPDDALYGDAIAACHAQEIQCLAGFCCVEEEKLGKKLNDFFRTATAAQLQSAADALVKEVNRDYLDSSKTPRRFDGLSFDIERLFDKTIQANVRTFYQNVADGLANTKNAGHEDKFVSIAGGGMVTDVDATTPGGGALQNSINQPYDSAVGHKALVLRPMCYDVFEIELVNPADAKKDSTKPPPTKRKSGNTALMKKWFEDIWTYCQTKPVPPEQFQYGIKPFPGTRNIAQKQVDAKGKFIEWSVSGKVAFDGYIDSPSELAARCREMRARGTGLILFGMSNPTDVAKYNYVLNGLTPTDPNDDATGAYKDFDPSNPSKNTAMPSKETVPRQSAHTKISLERLKKF